MTSNVSQSYSEISETSVISALSICKDQTDTERQFDTFDAAKGRACLPSVDDRMDMTTSSLVLADEWQ